MLAMASSWRRRPNRRFLPIRRDNVRKDAKCVEGRLRFRPSGCKPLILRTSCMPPLGTILEGDAAKAKMEERPLSQRRGGAFWGAEPSADRAFRAHALVSDGNAGKTENVECRL